MVLRFSPNGGDHLAEPGHPDADNVTGYEPLGRRHPRRHARRRSGRNDVSWPQGSAGAKPLDELVRAGRHLLRERVLAQFIVDPGLDPNVAIASDLVRRNKPRTGRLEGVPAFGPRHLEERRLVQLLALPDAEVACADVVGDHIAGDMLRRPLGRDPTSAFTDDDRKLCFIVELSALERALDRIGWPRKRRRGLEEYHR